MTLRRTALALALVVAFHWTRGPAEAASTFDGAGPQTPPPLMLEVTPDDSSIVLPLRAELRQLGVDVVESRPAASDWIEMRLVLGSDSLEVRITDEPTGRRSVRETFPGPGGRPMEPRTAVLHAIELLRWHLRFIPAGELSGSVPAAAATVASTPASLPRPAPTSTIDIGMLPFALYSPGGTRVGIGTQIDVLKRWGSWGARVLGGSVLLPNRISVPEGSVEVASSWAGLAGAFILGAQRRTNVELGLGGAIVVSSLRGNGDAGNVGRDDRSTSFAPFGEATVRRRMTPWLAINLRSTCFVPLESIRLHVIDREVGRYGQAVVALGLGVELTPY